MPHTIPATLIAGDGIGPEIVDATLAALDALAAPFEWDAQVAGLAGLAGVQASGDPLPPETPSGGGYRSSNVRLREEFQLYANLRPALTIVPGGRFDKIDLVVVRKNLEGLYIGHEHFVRIDGDPHAVAIVHKASIMKALTGIFLETGLDLYERLYKGKFELDTAIIDAAAMMLDHCNLPDKATRLRKAIDATLNIDKVRTGDLGGSAGTAAFTQALVSRIANG